jgi:hypothetical protein
MYRNKLNLKFFKLIIFSGKNAVLDQINNKKEQKKNRVGFVHATCSSEIHVLTD